MVSESTEFWGALVAGGALIVIGLAYLMKYQRFLQRAERTRGIVVDMQCGMTTHAGQVLYYPVLEFTTRTGRAVRATSRVGSHPAPADLGEAVIVRYDPRAPEEVEIIGIASARLVHLCLLIVTGGILIGFACL